MFLYCIYHFLVCAPMEFFIAVLGECACHVRVVSPVFFFFFNLIEFNS